jgi:hypothetical protein
VNSDGNVTFGAGDNASTERNLGRMVSGPPRVAPLLADFDPSQSGSVHMIVEGDRVTFLWSVVPQFGASDGNTFELTLRADGAIEFAYSSEDLSRGVNGVTGIAPGADQGGITGVDLSAATGQTSAGALAESFSTSASLDTVAIARRFYQTHGDEFEQLVIFSNKRFLEQGTIAYESTIKNMIGGIGDPIIDISESFGSAGRLESVVVMDSVLKFPPDVTRKYLGPDSALAVLAHETGHRWLAYALFRQPDGSASDELLGRQRAHWSFHFDSDASYLEGNDIQDLGGGQFETVAASERYSALDQYFMGLRAPEEVPPLFFVRDVPGAEGAREESPRIGARFQGTRVDLALADIIDVLGPRTPSVADSPKTFAQAYIFVVVDEEPNPSDIARVESFQALFPAYFAAACEGRMALTTTLY